MYRQKPSRQVDGSLMTAIKTLLSPVLVCDPHFTVNLLHLLLPSSRLAALAFISLVHTAQWYLMNHRFKKYPSDLIDIILYYSFRRLFSISKELIAAHVHLISFIVDGFNILNTLLCHIKKT